MDDLEKFVTAQAPLYERALAELRAGCKRSHWMWFIFPQIAGLGRSATARQYAIASLGQARAYLAHPLLGPRLHECCALVLAVEGRTAHQLFGDPDVIKFRSCLTLFSSAAPHEPVFAQCLEKYYGGVPDAATLALLG